MLASQKGLLSFILFFSPEHFSYIISLMISSYLPFLFLICDIPSNKMSNSYINYLIFLFSSLALNLKNFSAVTSDLSS